ncbi:MAG TPA: TIGR00374 family protein [Prevotellaceae bacterium]|nr:TIGR00374 family protein [Prevotellaceae bacterium]
MNTHKLIEFLAKVALPLALAVAILWWMYRGLQWEQLRHVLSGGMSWTWMLLSMPFGILAQVLRGMRWQQVMRPMGECPRLHVCVNAVFLSYASSLVVPRVGEVLRCGVLRRYEGVNFGRSVGTVVTERVVDMVLVIVLSLVVFVSQVPVFATFFRATGVSLGGLLSSFSPAGWAVAFACMLFVGAAALRLLRRAGLFSRTRAVVADLRDGLLSVRGVDSPLLFMLYSLGIWVCYFLHFYLTFFCFEATSGLGVMAALVAFVVGAFAVLVPTPNGAGPWHFAVKSVLVLYAVPQTDASIFVLIVHTLQTLLVVLLGLYALLALAFTRRRSLPAPCNFPSGHAA